MEKKHHLCLNEGMLLCSLSKVDRLSSGEIAETLGLTNSNASKVIRSVEDKGLVERVMGVVDKRQMYFSLTRDRKSTRLNSSHANISYAVFCLKKIKISNLLLFLY